jgi:hypothetical protein
VACSNYVAMLLCARAGSTDLQQFRHRRLRLLARTGPQQRDVASAACCDPTPENLARLAGSGSVSGKTWTSCPPLVRLVPKAHTKRR